jgi:hypothetical protein
MRVCLPERGLDFLSKLSDILFPLIPLLYLWIVRELIPWFIVAGRLWPLSDYYGSKMTRDRRFPYE